MYIRVREGGGGVHPKGTGLGKGEVINSHRTEGNNKGGVYSQQGGCGKSKRRYSLSKAKQDIYSKKEEVQRGPFSETR
jgi:hypothetical protein